MEIFLQESPDLTWWQYKGQNFTLTMQAQHSEKNYWNVQIKILLTLDVDDIFKNKGING